MVNNSNIVNAMVKYHFSDGIHTLPCKVNKQTHEVFDISGKTQLVKELVEDDDFSFDSDEEATADDVEDMEDYNVFVHSNKDSQDNGAPLAFASFCDDYPNREWTVFHI